MMRLKPLTVRLSAHAEAPNPSPAGEGLKSLDFWLLLLLLREKEAGRMRGDWFLSNSR